MFMEFYLTGARPYHRLNPQYEKLKIKEKEVMSFLHNLEIENIEARENCQELKKEINFYRNLQSRLMMEKPLIMKKLVTLKQESKAVQLDWAIIQQYLIDLNLNGKDEQEKTSNFQIQQNPVSGTATEQEVAPALEESLLQTELSPQEPPAELQPQQPQSSLDESSSSEFISSG